MSELEVLGDIEKALAQAETIEDFTDIAAMAKVAETLAREGNLGVIAQNQAVEYRVRAYAGAADVIDKMEPAKGGRGKTSNRDVRGLPDHVSLQRWRDARKAWRQGWQNTLAPEDETSFAAYVAAGASIRTTGKPPPHVANNSGENEWYTPPEYLNVAREVMGGINLDPASSAMAQKNVLAARFHTAEDDGLTHSWHGRVWLNPPYAQPLIGQFISQLVREYAAGNVNQAVVLVNNGTETVWGNQLIRVAAVICFPVGRVRFLDMNGNPGAPLQGQMLAYLGERIEPFIQHANPLGPVVRHE